MQQQKNKNRTTVRWEIKIGGTLYRVTSVYTGEKDLRETLEKLAVRRAYEELTNRTTLCENTD